ncbi:MAG: hypothetical protein ACRC7O_02020, partial [Fimbriiglobus sp.]
MADRTRNRDPKAFVGAGAGRPSGGPRLRLEVLDDRLTPATWDGGAAAGEDFRWTTPANWQGDLAPVPGEDLIFPRIIDNKGVELSGNILFTENDFPDGTLFGNISVQSTKYELRGSNRVILNGGTFSVDLSNINTLTGAVKVFIPIEFPATGLVSYRGSTAAAGGDRNVTFVNPTNSLIFASDLTLDVERGSGGSINEGVYFGETGKSGGTLSGSGAVFKTGSGGVTFQSSNPNNYTGLTKITAGTLTLASGATDQAIPGDLRIEGSTSLVEIKAANQLPETALVSIDKNGTL